MTKSPDAPNRGTKRGRQPGFSTRAIHAGQKPDPITGAVIPPLYQTSTYVQREVGGAPPYTYARTANPTRTALQTNIAALEGGDWGLCFASGMASVNAVLTLLRAGDHVICSENVYGGTYRLFTRIMKDFNIEAAFVDTTNSDLVISAIQPNTRMLYIETPSNPLLILTDIAAMAKIATKRQLILVADNTFMSPYFQHPLELGADLVIHSTTKFLNGHSDSVGGAVVTSNREYADRLALVQRTAGAILSPFDCWLILRGLKTLALRMQRHEENGRKVAEFLDAHQEVKHVFYPGLPSHPQHKLAQRQMTGFGALITFDLRSYGRAKAFLEALEVCSLGESLGGVETLISHPSSMTHASIPEEEREKLGITDGLVRVSVGVEDADDLLADLEAGLSSLRSLK